MLQVKLGWGHLIRAQLNEGTEETAAPVLQCRGKSRQELICASTRGEADRPAVPWERRGERRWRHRGSRKQIRFVEQDERVSGHEWGELRRNFEPWARGGRSCRSGDDRIWTREYEKRCICGLNPAR